MDSIKILNQLDKIVDSTQFVKKHKINSFLRYVVEKKIAGDENLIKSYSIGIDVFGKESDFNPSIDPIVRIQAGRLRNSLQQYYSGDGKNDDIIIEIPKGSYIPEFYFRKDIKEDKFLTSHEEGTSESIRILVLPFSDLSSDQSLEFCANTIAEDLISGLINYPDYEVISSYSAYNIRRESIPIEEIRNKFDVGFLIDGSVNLENTQLVFKVNLTDTNSKSQLWSNVYKRTVSDQNKYDIIREVSGEIISFIASQYGVINRRLWKASAHKEIQNLKGREAVYFHNQYLINVNREKLNQAEKAINKALEENPDFAMGRSILAGIFLDNYSQVFENREYNLAQAKENINAAIRIDPFLQHAYLMLAYYQTMIGEFKGVSETYDKILNLNPNEAFQVGEASFFLALSGKYEKGLYGIQKSTSLNPYYPSYFHHAFMLNHIANNEFEKAHKEAKLFHNPDFFWSHLDHASTYGLLGKTKEAEISYQKLTNCNPDFAHHPLEYIKIFVPQEKLLGKVIEGLRVAGLQI